MNAKKTAIAAVSYAMVAALAIGGTLAYQTDSDYDINTASVGNVSIEQYEYQRADNTVDTNKVGENETNLVPYKQNQTLYPAYVEDGGWTANGNDKLYYWNEYVHTGTAGNGLWDSLKMKGAMDKFVFVKNTGTSDCYFRTIIAFECPEGVTVGDGIRDTIGTNVNGSTIWDDEFVDYIVVDEVRYAMFEFIYTDILHPGEMAHPSLLQVAFSDKMTNEQAQLLGNNYEILVFSEACQIENLPTGEDGKSDAEAALDEAFYDVTSDDHPWVDEQYLPDTITGTDESEIKEDFKEAATAEKKQIVINLESDVTYDVTAWEALGLGGSITEEIIINGNGHTVTFNQLNSDWNNIETNNDAKLYINNAKITSSGYNDGPWNRHDLNFGCDVVLTNVTSDKAMAFKADAELNNVTISDANTSDTYAIWIQPNGQTVSLNGCTIDMISCTDGRGIKIDDQYVSNPQKVTLNVFDTVFKTEEKSAIIVKNSAGADITIGNIDISGVAADSTNAVWVDSDSEAYFELVNVTGATKIQE